MVVYPVWSKPDNWALKQCYNLLWWPTAGLKASQSGVCRVTIWLCTSNSFQNGDFWQTCPHSHRQKRIFLDSQILSHWYHFEAQLVGNNIWKKIGILSTEFIAILICIYKRKLLVIRFSSHTIRRTKSPHQSHLALRKYSSTNSY